MKLSNFNFIFPEAAAALHPDTSLNSNGAMHELFELAPFFGMNFANLYFNLTLYSGVHCGKKKKTEQTSFPVTIRCAKYTRLQATV